MSPSPHFAGELIGTFLMVFFGCGAVAVSILFPLQIGLFQVATAWGLGVTLAIYATRHLSCAHLNPAVSVAMAVGRRMAPRLLPAYLTGQVLGALLAAAALYLLFAQSIDQYETLRHIARGTADSARTAMIFSDYYPNPATGARVDTGTAFLAEAGGTFALVFLIFSLTEGCNLGRPGDALAPLFIGLAVTLIILIIAPLTQAGLNPARDLAPRLFAALAGWGLATWPGSFVAVLAVYGLGPVCGAILAAGLFVCWIEPLMNRKRTVCPGDGRAPSAAPSRSDAIR